MDKHTCSFDGCNKPHQCHGYCAGHNAQAKRGQTLRPLAKRALAPEDRFRQNVDMNGPTVPGHPELGQCWQWTGTKVRSGTSDYYGKFRLHGKQLAAHRVAWEMARSPIPDDMLIDHVCHNGLCVRVSHLRVASKAQNNSYLRGAKSNNKSTGIRNVYPYGSRKTPRWQVLIARKKYGVFTSLEEADAVAKQKREEVFGFSDF